MRYGRYGTALPPVARYKKHTLRNSHVAVYALCHPQAALSLAERHSSIRRLLLFAIELGHPLLVAKAGGQAASQL